LGYCLSSVLIGQPLGSFNIHTWWNSFNVLFGRFPGVTANLKQKRIMRKNGEISGLPGHSLSNRWLKAAVMGSIWAAFEIIVGSFLHNLRLPFAGAFLSMASVFLLILFLQLWREKGIVLRAGIICALMKSISPSAVILGPMVGILTEALFIEAAITLLGRNLAAYLLGGALAVLGTLLQKVVNLLILYGFDLITLADALYQFLVLKTGIGHLSPLWLIVTVSAVYLAAGALAAGLAFRAGKKYRTEKPAVPLVFQPTEPGKELFPRPEEQRYSLFLLASIVVAMIATLWLINQRWYLAAFLAGTGFIVFCLLRYKKSVRHLKKPSVWVQFLLITLVAALLWEWVSTGNYFSREGLTVGLAMNFRAMIIIFGFAAISVELRNPLIKAILYSHGFSNLYKALGLSFSALPSLIAALPTPGGFLRKRRKLAAEILQQSGALLLFFENRQELPRKIFLVTGAVHAGKTTFARELAGLLKQKGWCPGGFLSEGIFQNGSRHSYELVNLFTGDTFFAGSTDPQEGWIKTGRFWLNPQAFEAGQHFVRQGADAGCRVLFVDEVGHLEQQKKGWYPLLTELAGLSETVQVWVTRQSVAGEIARHWQLPASRIFDIAQITPAELAEIIEKTDQYDRTTFAECGHPGRA